MKKALLPALLEYVSWKEHSLSSSTAAGYRSREGSLQWRRGLTKSTQLGHFHHLLYQEVLYATLRVFSAYL